MAHPRVEDPSHTTIGPLRPWLFTGVPATMGWGPIDRQAFTQDIQVRTCRDGRRFLLLVTACNLLFWFTDGWVFRDIPEALPVMDQGRARLLALAAVVWFALGWWPRHVLLIATVGGGLTCAFMATGFGSLGGAGDGWFSFLMPLVFIPLLTWMTPLWRVGMTATFMAVIVVAYFILPPGRLTDPFTPTSLAYLTFLAGVSVLVGWYVDLQRLRLYVTQRALEAERDSLEARVAEKTRSLRQLVAHLDAVEDAQRTHLARELHDELGQLLTAQRLVLRTAIRRHETAPAAIGPNLLQLHELVEQVTAGVRGILTDLRPRVLGERGLADALVWLVERTQERGDLEGELRMPRELGPLPAEVEVAVYRCVQEALTNTVKHAEARRFGVEISRDAAALEALVWDDGRGLPTDGGTEGRRGMGILGIRERVAALQGGVELGPRPGGGTRLILHLPIAPAPAGGGSSA